MGKKVQNTNLQDLAPNEKLAVTQSSRMGHGGVKSTRTMIFKNVRNNRNSKLYIKKVVTNTLHIFKKIEKIYKRENGRKGLKEKL